MDIISLEQSDRLYWLGRYAERVYTTTGLFFNAYDTMLDKFDMEYREFCNKLDIPNIYQNADDFCHRYPFDSTDSNSLMSNLLRAYDNAIVLREEIGSDALCYVQLAIYKMQQAAASDAPLIDFLKVGDHLMSFWGICDDHMENDKARNILKLGKRHERLDLFSRLHESSEKLLREEKRLEIYLERAGVKYNELYLNKLKEIISAPHPDYKEAIIMTEHLLSV